MLQKFRNFIDNGTEQKDNQQQANDKVNIEEKVVCHSAMYTHAYRLNSSERAKPQLHDKTRTRTKRSQIWARMAEPKIVRKLVPRSSF
jgi:hypothetical protein